MKREGVEERRERNKWILMFFTYGEDEE